MKAEDGRRLGYDTASRIVPLLAAPVAPLVDPRRDRLLIDFAQGRPRVFTPDASPASVALLSVWPVLEAAADLAGDRLLTIGPRAA